MSVLSAGCLGLARLVVESLQQIDPHFVGVDPRAYEHPGRIAFFEEQPEQEV